MTAVRRVVTGHTPAGEAIVVSDDEVAPIPIGAEGSATTLLWGRDDPGQFPDDGTQPAMGAAFPPPGGCAVAVMTLAPGAGTEFHEFVRDALPPWSDRMMRECIAPRRWTTTSFWRAPSGLSSTTVPK